MWVNSLRKVDERLWRGVPNTTKPPLVEASVDERRHVESISSHTDTVRLSPGTECQGS